MAGGVAENESSFSLKSKARKGGIKKGASLRAQWPGWPFQEDVASATCRGHSNLSAANNKRNGLLRM